MFTRLRFTCAAAWMITAPALFAQWLDYPTPGVPQTPDGKPNLTAPAPRTADGKPDLSGMWGWVTIGPPCGARCTDTQISREFINGRLCLYRKKINLSTSLAGQAVGVKEVESGIWLVSFMDYDLGYIDLEEKTLQPLENPFGPKTSPMP